MTFDEELTTRLRANVADTVTRRTRQAALRAELQDRRTAGLATRHATRLRREETTMPDRSTPECDGLCIYAADVGVPVAGVAYPHPGCLLHWQGGRCECGHPDRCLSPTHHTQETP